MIIDSHVHLFPPKIVAQRKRFFDDSCFAELYQPEKSKMVSRDELLEMMHTEKIDRAVAMAFPFENDEYRMLQNEYLLESSHETRGKIISFLAAPKNIDCLDGWMAEARTSGAAGVGEVAFYSTGFGEKEKQYLDVLLQAAASADLPVCLHVNEPVGHRYPGKYTTSFELLFDAISKNKNTKIILAHWGGGIFFYALIKEVRAAFAHVMYDTAATPFLYDERIYLIAREIVGSEKILFGSDYPLLSPSRYFAAIRASFNSDAQAAVLSENALALFHRR